MGTFGVREFQAVVFFGCDLRTVYANYDHRFALTLNLRCDNLSVRTIASYVLCVFSVLSPPAQKKSVYTHTLENPRSRVNCLSAKSLNTD